MPSASSSLLLVSSPLELELLTLFLLSTLSGVLLLFFAFFFFLFSFSFSSSPMKLISSFTLMWPLLAMLHSVASTLLGLEVKVVQPRNGVLCAEVVRAELGLQDLQACLLVLHSQRIERWLHQGQRNGDGVVRGRRLNVVSAQQALVYLQGLLEIAQAETHPPLALLHHRDVDVGGRGVGVLLAHAEVEEDSALST